MPTTNHEDTAHEFMSNLHKEFDAITATEPSDEEARAFLADLDRQFEAIMARLGSPSSVYTEEPKPKYRETGDRNCEHCETLFTPSRSSQRFCSLNCRVNRSPQAGSSGRPSTRRRTRP